MSAPLTILCAGAYGIRNAGDDLPLVTLAAGMRRLLPDRELHFRALSRHPDPWEEHTYGVTMVPNLEYESGAAAQGRWFRGMNPDDDPAPFEQVRREIAACDLLVLGAGNALLDQTIGLLRGPIPLLALYGSLARLHERPVMLYGMSVGPLQTAWGRDLSRRLIADATVVTVRDTASRDLCRQLLTIPREIHLLPDATLATPPPAPDQDRAALATAGLDAPGDLPLIALGLRDLARPLNDDAERRQEEAVLALMTNLRERAAFLFIPQSTYREDDDRTLAARLVSRAPEGCRCLVVDRRLHPQDLIALYGLAQVTVASRLHAAVFSAIAGTPPVGLDYLPKVSGFIQQLDGGGVSLDLEQLTGDALRAKVNGLLSEESDLRPRLQRRVAKLRDQAAGHARLAVSAGLGLGITEDAS